MDNGFIILHRKLLDNPICQNPNIMALWVILLLLANHKQTKFLWNGKEEILERGQLITGRNSLAEKTGISAGSIPRYLDSLKKCGMLNIKTNNRFSLITIVKYNDYQEKRSGVDRRMNSQRTASEQPANTYNNVNNDNNETITVGAKPQNDIQEIFKIFYQINPNINFANKTERSAAEWLVKRYGLEKIISAAEYAISVQGNKFAPTIMTPYQLKDKMAALAKHKGSKEQSKESNTLIL